MLMMIINDLPLQTQRQVLQYQQISDHFSDLGHCEELVQQDQALAVLAWSVIPHFRKHLNRIFNCLSHLITLVAHQAC